MTGHTQHGGTFRYTGLRADSVSGDPQTQPRNHVISTLIRSATAVIVTLLVFRFVFMLFGANQNYLFVNIMYTLSTPFVAPFFGLFGYTAQYDASSFEYATLVAVLVYILAAWGIARLTVPGHLRRYSHIV